MTASENSSAGKYLGGFNKDGTKDSDSKWSCNEIELMRFNNDNEYKINVIEFVLSF